MDKPKNLRETPARKDIYSALWSSQQQHPIRTKSTTAANPITTTFRPVISLLNTSVTSLVFRSRYSMSRW